MSHGRVAYRKTWRVCRQSIKLRTIRDMKRGRQPLQAEAMTYVNRRPMNISLRE